MELSGYLTKNHAGRALDAGSRRRYFVSEGYHVQYFETEKRKTRHGRFDLRNVTAVRGGASSTPIPHEQKGTLGAELTTLELDISVNGDGKTQKTLIVSFDGVDAAEAAAWRRCWCSAVDPAALEPSTLLKALRDPALAAKFDADHASQAPLAMSRRNSTKLLRRTSSGTLVAPAPAGSEEDTFRTGAPAPAANGATVPHVAPAAVAAALTADDFFRCLDGLPCDTSKGGFTCQLVIASEARGALLTVADGVVRVDRFPAEPKKDRPKAEMSLWYKTAKLFLKDARGELSKEAWMAEYVKRRLSFKGDVTKGEALEKPWVDAYKKFAAEYAAGGGGGAAPAKSGAANGHPEKNGATKNGYAQLKDDEGNAAVAVRFADDEEEEEGEAPPPKGAEAHWFLKHIRTDMLLGTWLFLIGCVFYLFACTPPVLAHPDDACKWLEFVAAWIFVAGCAFIVKAAYPASLIELMRRLASPADAAADAQLTCVEKWLTSNPMLLGTQLANLGMLPYLIEGFVLLGRGRPGDEEMGWSYICAVIFFCPLLGLWTVSSMDSSMRLNNGRGSTYIYDGLKKCGCLRCCKDEAFWKRHIQADGMVTMWIFVVLMGMGMPFVPLQLLMTPLDYMAWMNGLALAAFFAGACLMLKTSYPENFNTSSFFEDDE